MDALRVQCSNCGAPLDVPAATTYLTCSFCGSTLVVKREGGAVFTELREAVARVERSVHRLEVEHALDRLDREWSEQRRAYESTGESGSQSLPGPIAGVLAVAMGIVVGTAILMFFPTRLSWFGFVFMGFGIVAGAVAMSRWQQFSRAQREYERARAALERKLEDAR